VRSGLRVLAFAFGIAGICPGKAGASSWTFDASAFVFDPPRDEAFVSPILAADRGALHLEARWNYEDLNTGSVFIGRTIEFDGGVVGHVVPVIGFVVGATDGIAPGMNLEIGWRRFSFTSETEIVLDLHDADANFLYTWLEGTFDTFGGLSLGFAGQRSKPVDTALDVQRGPMVSFARGPGWLGFYWFNPDRTDDETLVLAGGWAF
jgi:hypothetical protein